MPCCAPANSETVRARAERMATLSAVVCNSSNCSVRNRSSALNVYRMLAHGGAKRFLFVCVWVCAVVIHVCERMCAALTRAVRAQCLRCVRCVRYVHSYIIDVACCSICVHTHTHAHCAYVLVDSALRREEWTSEHSRTPPHWGHLHRRDAQSPRPHKSPGKCVCARMRAIEIVAVLA